MISPNFASSIAWPNVWEICCAPRPLLLILIISSCIPTDSSLLRIPARFSASPAKDNSFFNLAASSAKATNVLNWPLSKSTSSKSKLIPALFKLSVMLWTASWNSAIFFFSRSNLNPFPMRSSALSLTLFNLPRNLSCSRRITSPRDCPFRKEVGSIPKSSNE